MKKRAMLMYTVIVVLLNSCTLPKQAATAVIQKKAPVYDYTPPESGFVKSKDVSFILIKPVFANSFNLIAYEPFVSFSKSMENDYAEMLTKRGYPYIGPVNSYNEIVYADKKASDLTLESEIVFDISEPSVFRNEEGRTLLFNQPYSHFYAKGELMISGKVNFYLSEPFTHSKVWVKSIVIEAQRTQVTSSRNDFATLEDVKNDPKVWNSFVDILQHIYTKTLQTAWTYLDPEELRAKKKEAEEIRKNSSYQKF
jgi:hypothetical protein